MLELGMKYQPFSHTCIVTWLSAAYTTRSTRPDRQSGTAAHPGERAPHWEENTHTASSDLSTEKG